MNRRIVKVRWLDHQEESDESTLDEEVGLATYISIGYVTGEGDDWLEISRDLAISSYGETKTKAASICIHKALIENVEEILV